MCKFWVEKVLRVVQVLWARGGNTRGRNRETRQVAGMTRGKIRGHWTIEWNKRDIQQICRWLNQWRKKGGAGWSIDYDTVFLYMTIGWPSVDRRVTVGKYRWLTGSSICSKGYGKLKSESWKVKTENGKGKMEKLQNICVCAIFSLPLRFETLKHAPMAPETFKTL